MSLQKNVLVVGLVSHKDGTPSSEVAKRDQARISSLRRDYNSVFSLDKKWVGVESTVTNGDRADENFHVPHSMTARGASKLVELMNTPTHSQKKLDYICLEYQRMAGTYYQNFLTGENQKHPGRPLRQFLQVLCNHNKINDGCQVIFAKCEGDKGGGFAERWNKTLCDLTKQFGSYTFIGPNLNPLFKATDCVEGSHKKHSGEKDHRRDLYNLNGGTEDQKPFCCLPIKLSTQTPIDGTRTSKTVMTAVTSTKKHVMISTPSTKQKRSASLLGTSSSNKDMKNLIVTSKTAKQRDVIISPPRKRSKKQKRRRSCACGHPQCNQILESLGFLFVKTGFSHRKVSRSVVDDVNGKIQSLRYEKTREQLRSWRRTFCPDRSSDPPNSLRINELHYPLKFLIYSKNQGTQSRLLTTLPVSKAKEFGMYREEYILKDCIPDPRVVTVPCLTTEEGHNDRVIYQHSTSDGNPYPSSVHAGIPCVCFACRENETNPRANEKKTCLQPYHHKEPNVFVSKSTIHGFGLFARKQIKKDTLICYYTGTRRDTVDTTNSTSFFCTVEGKDNEIWHVDSTDEDNHSGRWSNHCLPPNAELVVPPKIKIEDKKFAILLLSKKDIEPYEEITTDYGKRYFTNDDGKVHRHYYSIGGTLLHDTFDLRN